MEEKLILKNNLMEARIEAKLSQSALANMAGVSRNTISSIFILFFHGSGWWSSPIW